MACFFWFCQDSVIYCLGKRDQRNTVSEDCKLSAGQVKWVMLKGQSALLIKQMY